MSTEVWTQRSQKDLQFQTGNALPDTLRIG